MGLWNDGEPIADRFDGVDVPAWISNDICPRVIAAIVQGGCDSGAYMPAVTYYEASQTMAKHGDDVLDYLDTMGEMPDLTQPTSWSGIAVFFLSAAVELWAIHAQTTIEDIAPEEDKAA